MIKPKSTVIFFVVLINLIALSAENALSAEAARKLVLSAASGDAGAEIEIAVSIDDAQDVLSYRIVIQMPNFSGRYPLEYVTGSASSSGTLTQKWGAPVENDLSQNPDRGIVIFVGAGGIAPPLANGPGVLMKFKLRIKDAARNGLVELAFDPALTTLNDGHVAVDLANGSVRVDAVYLWGDVDRDGSPGLKDARSILQYDALLTQTFEGHYDIQYQWPNDFPPEADVNGDKTIGAYDAWQLIQYEIFNLIWFPADLDKNGFGPDAGTVEIKPGTVRRISLPSLAAHPGEILEVHVQINEAESIASYRVAVELPSASPDYPLEYVVGSATGVGTFTASWPAPVVNDKSAADGYVLFINMAERQTALTSGQGTLFKFKVRIKETANRGTVGLQFPSSEKNLLVSRLNDGQIPLLTTNGSMDVLEIPQCGLEFIPPNIKALGNLQPLFRIQLPSESPPLFSMQGDMLAAASAEGDFTLISRILHYSPNGDLEEIAVLRNAAPDWQILNLFAAGRNRACVVIGGKERAERCFVFFNVPFDLALVDEYMIH
ncbi:MAG: hypothetical protein AB1656_00870 [Candidatus Omnitrophota bacterium]